MLGAAKIIPVPFAVIVIHVDIVLILTFCQHGHGFGRVFIAIDRMTEIKGDAHVGALNVIEQALNVCQSTVMQDAWQRGQQVQVHSWIYALKDGRLKALNNGIASAAQVAGEYRQAVELCWSRYEQ